MDTTAIGIGAGLIGAAVYAAIRGARQKSFDVGSVILVFLATFSIPGGVLLMIAAYSGNAQDLPSSWREHVAVAGIAVIGLAVQFLCNSFSSAWPQPARAESQNGAEPRTEDS